MKEEFKIRKNIFKKYIPERTGLVLEFNGEVIVGIIPPDNEESFLILENGSTIIVKEEEFSFEIPEDTEIRTIMKTNVGLEIKIYKDKNEVEKSYFIPVKSNWTVEFRNRRACGKTVMRGDEVWLHLKRK